MYISSYLYYVLGTCTELDGVKYKILFSYSSRDEEIEMGLTEG